VPGPSAFGLLVIPAIDLAMVADMACAVFLTIPATSGVTGFAEGPATPTAMQSLPSGPKTGAAAQATPSANSSL
jgi:hypothetical protein